MAARSPPDREGRDPRNQIVALDLMSRQRANLSRPPSPCKARVDPASPQSRGVFLDRGVAGADRRRAGGTPSKIKSEAGRRPWLKQNRKPDADLGGLMRCDGAAVCPRGVFNSPGSEM